MQYFLAVSLLHVKLKFSRKCGMLAGEHMDHQLISLILNLLIQI